MKAKCSNCKYWKNKQAELDYVDYFGICIHWKWKFDIKGKEDECMVLDRCNKSGKHKNTQRFESLSHEVPIGDVNESRYCFVTGEKFGCTHYEE